jgi:hypothetical protein
MKRRSRREFLRSVLAASPFAALAQQAAPPTGVWEAVRANRQALPMTDQVVGKDGLTHAVRLHGMTVRLLRNGRFQAALRYRRAILSRRERIDTQPLLNDTWTGAFTQTGNRMHFVPQKKGDQQVQPFDGVAVARRITISFDYEIVTRKHYVLDLDRNDNIL